MSEPVDRPSIDNPFKKKKRKQKKEDIEENIGSSRHEDPPRPKSPEAIGKKEARQSGGRIASPLGYSNELKRDSRLRTHNVRTDKFFDQQVRNSVPRQDSPLNESPVKNFNGASPTFNNNPVTGFDDEVDTPRRNKNKRLPVTNRNKMLEGRKNALGSDALDRESDSEFNNADMDEDR